MRIISEKADLFQLIPSLETLIINDTIVGRSGNVRKITVTSTINNIVVIANLMNEMQATQTLEVGMAYGTSALTFCAMHSNLNLQQPRHTAIDPFELSVYDDCGVLNIERANLGKYLKVYYERSCLVLPQLISQREIYDLIYIDGSHLFEDVFLDVYFGMRLLRPGGVILIDDSSDPRISKVISFARKNLLTSIEEIDLSPYRLPGQVSLKYYLAKQLGRTQLTGFRITGQVDRPYGTPLINF